MKSLLTRPIQALTLVFVLLLTLALAALAMTTWSNLNRIEAVRARVARTQLLHEAEVLIKEEQLQLERGQSATILGQLEHLRALLSKLPSRGGPIGAYTRERIAELDTLLGQAERDPAGALAGAGDIVDRMLQRETTVQTDLLDSVRHDTMIERRLATGAMFVFPGLVLVALLALRQRIFGPIGNLRNFLSRLAEGDFTPVPLSKTDRLLRPLFENYNALVGRLAQLEESNRKRTVSLTEEVRAATRALLSQQQRLTRAERLATVGEVSASLAHELRNPIAGIHVSLCNLRKEVEDAELGHRLDLVIAEMQRIARLLNGLLQQSSHVPEAPREVEVDALVREFVTLLRYQVPPHIVLETDIVPGLRCTLPEDAFRQVLLNLVSNAVEVLRESIGTITIRARRLGDAMRVDVLDDGPGFPDALLARGIQPFASFREDGTGLGLAIVKRFAHDLGGTFSISNRAPHGALATITLPCNDRDAAPDRG
ncbi:MAG TPA: ATP-binding protein [Burkholderiales bacterium]|nr:ATP-binding protein [Burkholderiales bacterium]